MQLYRKMDPLVKRIAGNARQAEGQTEVQGKGRAAARSGRGEPLQRGRIRRSSGQALYNVCTVTNLGDDCPVRCGEGAGGEVCALRFPRPSNLQNKEKYRTTSLCRARLYEQMSGLPGESEAFENTSGYQTDRLHRGNWTSNSNVST